LITVLSISAQVRLLENLHKAVALDSFIVYEHSIPPCFESLSHQESFPQIIKKKN